MELKCAFVLVLVNFVAAHGYGVKGGGAIAKAESSATATSGVGEVPVSIPTGGGFSSSFSKSSSSSYASSSASSSSFSYSSAGSGGLTGTNGIPLSGKGDCVSGVCQDQLNEENNDPDTALNGLKAYAGSAAGANAFATSNGYLQNAGHIPCTGNECSNQGLTGAKSSSISGSLAHAQSGGQSPCTGENCANQNSLITGAKANSVSGSSGYSLSSNQSPCTGDNCSVKSNCASGTCDAQLQTRPSSYGYEPKETIFAPKQDTKTPLNSKDENSKYKDSSAATSNSKLDNVYGLKDVFNNVKQGQGLDIYHNTDKSKTYDQSSDGYGSIPASPPYSQQQFTKGTETLNPFSSYSTPSPKCISGNCDYGFTKTQYPNSGQGGAAVAIPATELTVPKESNNPESLCTAPGCQTLVENKYPNRPSSYNVPIYAIETTGPKLTSQEKDVTCISANCKNNVPHTDYSPNHSNSMPSVYNPVPFNTNKDNTIEDTKDIEVIKSPSTSYNKPHTPSTSGTTSACSSGNCANTYVDKPKDSKLPSYLASLPSQQYKPISTTYNGVTPNCGGGNCVSYPSSFVNAGAGIPLTPQTAPTLNCLGLHCAPQSSYQIKEPLPNIKPNYYFTTPSLSSSPPSSQPPKYSNTPYPIYQVPIVSSKNPSYIHGTPQQSNHNHLPISGTTQIGTTSLPSASSQTHSIIGSIQKGAVYTGGFGGPTGLLTPNDYTIPAKPLSPEQRPPVKPFYPYDGSLAPTTTTVNYPANHKVTCANGNCGNHPSVSHYGQGTSSSVASTNSETESEGVLYTGGFGGPPGVLVPYEGNTKNFSPSGVSTKPATTSSYNTGNIYSPYNSFSHTPSTKPHTDTTVTSAESNAFNKQGNIGHNLQGGGSTALNKGSSLHGDKSHFEFGNAFGLFMSGQPNSFSSSQPNTLNSYSASGSGSQTITGSPNGAAATAGAFAHSGSKTQENGKINKYPPCGNGECGSHYGGSNSGLGLLNSGSSSSAGAGATASAQSGVFSGFFENNEANTSQPKEGCAGGCASNGVNSDGGNNLYGTAAIAKSSASATSGVGTDYFGSGQSFASSSATAHASSGAAVKGSYGKR